MEEKRAIRTIFVIGLILLAISLVSLIVSVCAFPRNLNCEEIKNKIFVYSYAMGFAGMLIGLILIIMTFILIPEKEEERSVGGRL